MIRLISGDHSLLTLLEVSALNGKAGSCFMCRWILEKVSKTGELRGDEQLDVFGSIKHLHLEGVATFHVRCKKCEEVFLPTDERFFDDRTMTYCDSCLKIVTKEEEARRNAAKLKAIEQPAGACAWCWEPQSVSPGENPRRAIFCGHTFNYIFCNSCAVRFDAMRKSA
jgi:hypothetical protein